MAASGFEKFIAGLTAIGLATTLVLPRRQTAAVITAFGKLISGSYTSVIVPSK